MIVTHFSEDGTLICHKSDNNKYIQKVGTEEIYPEAWDIIPCRYEYVETGDEIENY